MLWLGQSRWCGDSRNEPGSAGVESRVCRCHGPPRRNGGGRPCYVSMMPRVAALKTGATIQDHPRIRRLSLPYAMSAVLGKQEMGG